MGGREVSFDCGWREKSCDGVRGITYSGRESILLVVEGC